MKHQSLIAQLQSQGITDPRILHLMAEIPREKFVLLPQRKRAYENVALPIACNQTISQPYIVALMSQALCQNLHAEKILEIGTGSGYQTAILATLFKQIWTVERIETLKNKARATLNKMGYQNIEYRVGDGAIGWPEAAPFDGIIVTAAAKKLPKSLLSQLNPQGGLMVIPLGRPHEVQVLTLIQRNGDDFEKSILEQVCFVPLVTDE